MKNEKQIELSFIEKLKELKYIYREDIKDKASLEENFRKHDPLSPLLVGNVKQEDRIRDADQKPWIDHQLSLF